MGACMHGAVGALQGPGSHLHCRLIHAHGVDAGWQVGAMVRQAAARNDLQAGRQAGKGSPVCRAKAGGENAERMRPHAPAPPPRGACDPPPPACQVPPAGSCAGCGRHPRRRPGQPQWRSLGGAPSRLATHLRLEGRPLRIVHAPGCGRALHALLQIKLALLRRLVAAEVHQVHGFGRHAGGRLRLRARRRRRRRGRAA